MRGVVDPSCTGSVAFCVSARTGLGHLRRVTNIAAAIRQVAPDVRIDLLSNASVDGLSAAEQTLFSRTFLAERSAMARILATEKPDVVAVDTAVIPDLELLPQSLALILRETVPEQLVAFRLPGERLWDEVIVAEPSTVWAPGPDRISARRTTNAGWIYRTTDHAHQILRKRPGARTLLIAAGGGGTSETLAHEIGDIVRNVRDRAGVPLHVVQVLGPRAPRSAVIANIDELADVGSNLDLAFAEADVVISTSGYNSILELAATTTPALLCSIARTYDDQTSRAATWASSLGLAHQTGRTERSAEWIAGLLATGQRRPKAHLCTSGSDRAAQILIDLVRAGHHLDRHLFIKPARAIDPPTLDARARALLGVGVPTPQTLTHRARDRVAFARLKGPTASVDWIDARASRSGDSPSNLVEQADAITAPLAALHGAATPELRLGPLDPWRRIVPRLATGAAASTHLGELQWSRAVRLAAELRDTEQRMAPRQPVNTIVHGDFHLGQLIRPIGRDGYVVVDLDDLAIGPRESDIGNCIAHIATSPMLWARGPHDALSHLSPIFAGAYERHSNSALDAKQIELHCGIAMLRRALKLAERGEHALIGLILDAVEALAQHLAAPARRSPPQNHLRRRSAATTAAPAAE